MVTDNMEVITDNNKNSSLVYTIMISHKSQAAIHVQVFTSSSIHKHDTIDRAPTVLLHPKTVQKKVYYDCIAEILIPQVLI